MRGVRFVVFLILAFVSGAALSAVDYVPTGPRAYVTPNANGLSSTKFIDLGFWEGALASAGVGGAVATQSNPATLTTAMGKTIPLPNNWAAQIPRATLAQSASKILMRGTVVGLVGFGLYDLLKNQVGLNADGMVSDAQYQILASGSACYGYSQPQIGPGSSASVCAGWVSHCQSKAIQFKAQNKLTQNVTWSMTSAAGGVCSYHVTDTSPGGGSTGDYTKTMSPTGGSTSSPATEADLSQRIQASPVSDAQILEAALNDSVSKNIDFGESGLITPTTPISSNAAPVSAPQETLGSETFPNADGTTSTKTTKVTTTATPEKTGTTAGDSSVTWNVSNTYVTTTTNNTTGATTITTTTTNEGSSNQRQNDAFTGSNPDDGFAAGRAKINTVLCGGNCSTALSCSSGTCTPTERINALKSKYALSTVSTGSCPAFSFDISAQRLGSHSSTAYCDLAEQNRTMVSVIIGIAIAFVTIRTVMEA